MPKPILIASFYKFAPLPDYRELRAPLLVLLREHGIRGTILLADEGINASIAGPRPGVEAILAGLRVDPRLSDLAVRETFHDAMPFARLKVRLKREIVAMKTPGIDPRARRGAYIEPEAWNDLITQEDVLLLDARNDYEARLGAFCGATNPETAAFHQLPRYLTQSLDAAKHKRIAMYCTGGIRCEKASAFLLDRGFQAVYQLRGGILNYLEKVEPAESLWQGECFVFDERVSLDHSLNKGRIRICDDCKTPVQAAQTPCPRCGSANLI